MIYIVSGLPRSGTSLAMQMLAAGGIPVLTDGVRAPDANNPRGYYEWEPIKRIPQEPGQIAAAEGKAVKVISSLAFSLPPDHDYRVIFMLRPLEEVLESQAAMIRSLGTRGPALAAPAMLAALRSHLAQAISWLERRQDGAHFRVQAIGYHDLIKDPCGEAGKIASFLNISLDTQAMAVQVDPALHRRRGRPQT